MKKSLLILFVFIFQFNLFSQDLEPIVDQVKKWNVLNITNNINGDDGNFDDYYSTSIYRIGEEVIANGLNYHVIVINGQSSIYYIRENTNHQVYLYDSINNTEWLLYDFNVEVGDILSLYNEFGYEYLDWTITSIETVFFANQDRKKVTLDYQGVMEVWYEGIGSQNGLLQSCNFMIDASTQLLCFYSDNELLLSTGQSCNITNDPINDVLFFIENDFELVYFLLNNSDIEYPAGAYSGEFNAQQGSSNNEVFFNIGGICGNSTSVSILVNPDNTLAVMEGGGETLTACDPTLYPEGDGQEGRFFSILKGNYMMQPDNPLPVYYSISDDKTLLTVWTDENEKLVFNVSERLGIADEDFKNQFVIYPNPVKNKLIVKTNNTDYSVEIYTILGKRVLQKQTVISTNEISTSSLSKGIYLLKITSENYSFTKKFVKL